MHEGRIDSHSKRVTIDEVVGHDELLKIDGHRAMIVPENHPLFPVLDKYRKMIQMYGECVAYEIDTILGQQYETHKKDIEGGK